MKRILKRTVAMLLCTVLLLGASVFVLSAQGRDAEPIGGLSFTHLGSFSVEKTYSAAPRTLEAVLHLPTNISERAGVILGNRLTESNDAYLTLGIHTNGVPYLSFRDAKGIHYEFRFDAVDVRNDGWVHLCVVQDARKGEVRCYLNGALAQASTTDRAEKPYSDYHADMMKNTFYIGGDGADQNANYFKGELRSLALFADVRTDAQIAADAVQGAEASDESLLALYDMTGLCGYEDIPDLSASKAHAVCLREWFDESLGAYTGKYDFTLAVVGDTQNFIYREAEGQIGYQGVTERLYSRIVNRAQEKKTQYVIGLGDVTDNDFDSEWELAKSGITLMDGVVPYTLIRGHGHDTVTKLNRYFADHAPFTENIGGTFKEGSVANSWQTFSFGGKDYLILGLDFGAPDDVLAWADGVVAAHPNHHVIVTTHCYLDDDGTTVDRGEISNATGYDDDVKYNEDPEKYVPDGRDSDAEFNDGQSIWSEFISRHENIFLVISGHIIVKDVVINQRKGEKGNTVTEVLINAQGMDDGMYEGGVGMVATFYFDQEERRLAIEYYSTVQGAYRRLNVVDLDHDHDFETVLVPSTCKDRGYRAEICDCGKEAKRFSLPLSTSHIYGSEEDAECDVCGLVRETESEEHVTDVETEEVPTQSDAATETPTVPETEAVTMEDTESVQSEESEEPATVRTEEVTEQSEEIPTDTETAPPTLTDEDGDKEDPTVLVVVGATVGMAILLCGVAAWILRQKRK